MTLVAVKCPYCGLFHDYICPRIKSVEYTEDGKIKKVEFFEYQTKNISDVGSNHGQ